MNRIVTENNRPGTPDWRLHRPARAREIEGYAGATSINRGESIALYVNTTAPAFAYEVFRMGWYQGHGARRVVGPVACKGQEQALPAGAPLTGLVDCAWSVSCMLSTADADEWVSGIYLVRLTESRAQKQSYILFVVREDGVHAPLLVQQSVTTYQAYNTWGGKSFYKWSSTDNRRATKLSFNRPYAANPQNPAAAYGMGAGEFLTNSQPHPDQYGISNAGWEYNLVRWLEREGFDLTYCTNLDTHRDPWLLVGRRAWLSGGHDEYWSWAMRDHIEQARDRGINLAFLSANTAYWQIRLEASPATGMPDRVMTCHKSAKRDPIHRTALTHLATDKWRNLAQDCSEDRLLGIMYSCDPVAGDVRIVAPRHWVFAHTGLQSGDVIPGLLGYEVDSVQCGSPTEVEILAASPYQSLQDPASRGFSHMTFYTAASGAMVFATGSMQWSWGLDDFNVPELRTSCRSAQAAQITRNVLTRFTR